MGISFCQNCEADGNRAQVCDYLNTTFETSPARPASSLRDHAHMRRYHAPAFGEPYPGLHLAAHLAGHGSAMKQSRRDSDVAAVGDDDGVRERAGEAGR